MTLTACSITCLDRAAKQNERTRSSLVPPVVYSTFPRSRGTGSETGVKNNLLFIRKLCRFNIQLWFLVSLNLDNNNTLSINYVVRCVLDTLFSSIGVRALLFLLSVASHSLIFSLRWYLIHNEWYANLSYSPDILSLALTNGDYFPPHLFPRMSFRATIIVLLIFWNRLCLYMFCFHFSESVSHSVVYLLYVFSNACIVLVFNLLLKKEKMFYF